MTQRLREVALADAGRADKEHVLVALYEGARGEVEHLGLREARVEAEVEVLERLGVLEARPAEPETQLLRPSTLHLVVEHAEEKLEVTDHWPSPDRKTIILRFFAVGEHG